MNRVPDSEQRALAIDPTRSFCITAPAGSGKTELLIQRFLALLSRVARPEQVLAITFTRKAAAEMRERVLLALNSAQAKEPCTSDHERVTRSLATSVLQANATHKWRLLRDVSRLNIKTIDSFCAGLTRQMPVLSLLGAQAAPQDDATPLYEEAVSELFAMLDTDDVMGIDLRRILQHFDNRWPRVRQLLVEMLGRRDQWQKYIGVHETPDESEDYLVGVTEGLVREALRELSGMLAPYREDILELQRFAAENLGTVQLREFPQCEVSELADWRRVRSLLMTHEGSWRKPRGINKHAGFPADKTEEAQRRKAQVQRLLSDLIDDAVLEQRLAAVAILPEIDKGSAAWELVLSLSRLLPALTARLLLVFSRHGAVDYSQLSQSALHALGEDDAPTDLALRLDYRIEHILVDEFQDTSINQYELLRKLTRGWGEYNDVNPETPRTLLVVGDAQQSIYGFRDANVSLFQRVAERGFNGVMPQSLILDANFRSDRKIVEWVNNTFSKHFPANDDIGTAQVSHRPAKAIRRADEDSTVTLDAFRGDGSIDAEVETICDVIARCVALGETDIGVLGRQRSHLRPIRRRLKEMSIPCHAIEMDRLAHSPVATDLMTLCRALVYDADRLAWLALLRAPWCGLSLKDLLAVSRYGPAEQPLRTVLQTQELDHVLSKEGAQRIQHLRQVMLRTWSLRDRLSLRIWIEQAWVELGGPACITETLMLEDAESFFQLLERAEDAGIGLNIDWLEKQVQGSTTSAGSPDCAVHLMTLHKAKGLEFGRVFIPRLDGKPRADSGELLRWDEQINADGETVFLLAANDNSEPGDPTLYRYLGQRRKIKQAYEATRLLYVGVTRAAHHLHLSASIGWNEGKNEAKRPVATSLLATIWETFVEQAEVHELAGDEQSIDAVPVLLRLTSAGLPPAIDVEPEIPPPENFPERPTHHFERVVGIVVHLALEQLSQRDTLPTFASDQDRSHWRSALQNRGLTGDDIEQGLEHVLHSVNTTLQKGGEGRWILSRDRRDAQSEWALTCLDGAGMPKDIVIDRSFIDEQGQRWVIDYKTSCPTEGESLEAFTTRESAHYIEQLRCYRDVLRDMGNEPILCALFFTSVGLLHTLVDLNDDGVR
ncbi:MAG: UvrD-helicase domain-containing protein [Halioglobus sp.]|nr:UvrD-helicase domain-containing protein [Halioglobus sp.]